MLELPYTLSILTALIAAAIGVRHGRTLYRRGFQLSAHISVRDCPLIPICVVLFVALHIATSTVTGDPTIGWALPVTFEYYLPGIMWVLKTAFAAFALTAICAVGYFQRARVWIPLALFSIAALCLMDGLTRLAVQPYVGEMTHQVENGVIMQSTPSTCAAATAANIATQLGIPKTEAQMVELMNTTWAGTSPAQIVFGFRRLGLRAHKIYIPDRDLARVRPPAVLLVEVQGEVDAHAVAYMGLLGPGFDIWDPDKGRRRLSRAEIAKTWHGRAIEVSRQQ